MMDLQKRLPQYPSLFGASHDPRAAPQPPPTYGVSPTQQVYYDSPKQHGVQSSQPANTMAYPYSTPMSSAPPTPASSTPYNMPTPLQVENRNYQVPQMNYELPKNHDPRQKDHNKRHRRSHSRNNSHDQLIYREDYLPVLCDLVPTRQYYYASQSQVLHPSRLWRGWRLIDYSSARER
ncbi:hypothetical protein IFM51744_03088 [Aspergillus udagawae]|nr:hypothetical protein IFM51744_03088 [Aspergillus udagawae]